MNPQPTATPVEFRLQAADAGAVDVLLDADAMAAPANLAGRTRHVGRLLGLLDALPQPTPGTDLVERTMRRVAEAPAARATVGATAPAASVTGNVGPAVFNMPDEPDGA